MKFIDGYECPVCGRTYSVGDFNALKGRCYSRMCDGVPLTIHYTYALPYLAALGATEDK